MLLKTSDFGGLQRGYKSLGKTHFDIGRNVPELCPLGEFDKCPYPDLSTKGISINIWMVSDSAFKQT